MEVYLSRSLRDGRGSVLLTSDEASAVAEAISFKFLAF